MKTGGFLHSVLYVYQRVCVHIPYTQLYAHTHTTHTHTHIYIYICVCVCVVWCRLISCYVWLSLCMCICVHLCRCRCAYIHVCAFFRTIFVFATKAKKIPCSSNFIEFHLCWGFLHSKAGWPGFKQHSAAKTKSVSQRARAVSTASLWTNSTFTSVCRWFQQFSHGESCFFLVASYL